MKQKLFAGVMGLALGAAPAAFGQTDIWENWGVIEMPPPIDNIDALTFINHKGASFTFNGDAFYNTYNTLNYTNQGLMVGNPGFDFETVPTATGLARRAANFVNAASGNGPDSGVINCSGLFTFIIAPLLPAGNLTGSSVCLVDATNIVNSGAINMSASSLIKMTGENVDLSRGSISMVNPSTFVGFFNAGILDGYWGVGTADINYRALVNPAGQASLLNPANLIIGFGGTTFALTDLYDITTRQYFLQIGQLFLQNPTVYFYDSGQIPGTSNRMVLAVALVNTNSAFANKVFFPTDFLGNPFEIAVQWQWTSTNFPTGTVSTNNYFYLTDNFGEVTNLQTFIDGQAGIRPTRRPVNYNFFQGAPFSTVLAPADPVAPSTVPFIPGIVTNQYSAYQGIFTAGTSLATDVAGGNVTNMAGRIEVTADTRLDLTQSRLDSLNYLLLRATNHYVGSKNAVISAPNLDLYLRTTNGSLAITNLVAPYLNHPEGTCDLWSARWTNVVNNITNSFHVLFVESRLSPVTLPRIQTLKFWVTNSPSVTDLGNNATNNLIISDVLNITSNLVLNAEGITITTNAGNIFAPVGQINLLNTAMTWPSATPGLMYLTNWGIFTAQNSVFFGGSHTQPPYNTNLVNIPYQAFVNHGFITNQASLIWSTYFENDGIFDCGGGSLNLQQAVTATLTNGAFYAPDGDIGIASANLFASNHVLLAGGALSFTVSSVLDDGSLAANSADSITNKNFWTAGNGINLLVRPGQSSLLGTTITNFAPDYQLVVNRWAGADLGATPAGFANNAAIGHLILDGVTNNTHEFLPVTGTNALYVDLLDLRDYIATNVDNAKNYASIQVDPGMKIYYGQALANGISIAERLNGKNGGGFVWVSNYNTGFFSSTNMVYPDGSTNRLNTALVTSCTIDSNNNGIPNCMDPAPISILSPAGLALAVTVTNQPIPAAVVSWTAFPSTTNYLYAAPLTAGADWQVVTNFVYTGRFPSRVSVTDLIRTNAPRFYRVGVRSP